MNNLLSNILILSIAGSVVVSLMLVLRPVTVRIFPAKWQYDVGKIAMALYLLPITPIINKIISSLYQFVAKLSPEIQAVSIPKVQLPTQFTGTVNTLTLKHLPATIEKHASLNIIEILFITWFIGALTLTGWNIYCYYKFRLALNKSNVPINGGLTVDILNSCKVALAIHNDVKIMQSDHISSPMLVGLNDHMILLPTTKIAEADLKLILTHELIHLKRKDLWVKILMLIVSIMHWFNPLVYVLRKDLNIWCELSCDEELVCEISQEQRKRYGEAILNTLSNNHGMNGAFYSSFCESNKQIKRRLTRMLKVKKVKKSTIFIAVIAVITVSCMGLLVANASTENILNITNLMSADSQADAYNDSADFLEENNSSVDVPKSSVSDISTDNNIDDATNTHTDEVKHINVKQDFLWPITGYHQITAKFGSVMHPAMHKKIYHNGMDIAAPENTPVLAVNTGIIADFGNDKIKGIFIVINHGNDIQTSYSHLFRLPDNLAIGDQVQQGDVIGYVGSTGYATGPHLHLQLIIAGENTDPATMFKALDTKAKQD